MQQKSPREIQAALSQPFAPEDLEWRLQRAFEEKGRGIAVPYVTNRAIQNRLDEVVGPENWYNDYKPWHSAGKKDSQLCGIAIYFEGRGFVTKWDGAEDSDIEPVKGGLSDSMKRAAVQWGVGRTLYNMDSVWVSIEKKGKSFDIQDSERPKLDRLYLDMLKRLGLTPAPPMGTQSQLVPKNANEGPNAAKTEAPKPEAHKAAGTEARKPETANITPMPVAQPAYEYIVTGSTIQNGMKIQSTVVMLRDAGGKETKAYARGARPELQPGVLLRNVTLTVMKQGAVVYNALEKYEIAAPGTAA